MDQVRRRQLVLAATALLISPRARAQQQAAKVRRIGFLGIAFASGYVRELDWIRAGLRDLGYVEGKNLRDPYRLLAPLVTEQPSESSWQRNA